MKSVRTVSLFQTIPAVIYHPKQAVRHEQDRLVDQVLKDKKTEVQQLREVLSKQRNFVTGSLWTHPTKGHRSYSVKVGKVMNRQFIPKPSKI